MPAVNTLNTCERERFSEGSLLLAARGDDNIANKIENRHFDFEVFNFY